MDYKGTFAEMARIYNRRLVASLKCQGTLTSPLIEDAFLSIPRHAFIDYYYVHDAAGTNMEQWRCIERPASGDAAAWLESIYADVPLVTAFDASGAPSSSSSAPGIMAFMLETLQLRPSMRVLEIGTGTGYNAALLAHIVGDPQLVFSVELDAQLAYSARQKLEQVVGSGTTVHSGNGLNGYSPGAPYDRIIATGSYHKVPLPWLDQLKEGGILVMNLGRNFATAMGILQLQKVGPNRAAHGKFLSPAAFMQLREPEQLSLPDAISQFSRYARRPLAAKKLLSRAAFDPTILMDMQLAFLIQCELPFVSLMWIPKQEGIPFTVNLIDTQSETIVQFRSTEQADTWEMQVRGAFQTWERLYQAYQQWVSLQRPKITDYVFEVDEQGEQSIRIPATISGGLSPTWAIS